MSVELPFFIKNININRLIVYLRKNELIFRQASSEKRACNFNLIGIAQMVGKVLECQPACTVFVGGVIIRIGILRFASRSRERRAASGRREKRVDGLVFDTSNASRVKSAKLSRQMHF